MDSDAVAVVSMEGLFPGAATVDELWQNLVSGREGYREYSVDELVEKGLPRRIAEAANYVRRCPTVEVPGEDELRALGLDSEEVRELTPQVRVLLLCAHRALEKMGSKRPPANDEIGLWVGLGFAEYALKRVVSELDPDELTDGLAAVCAARRENPLAPLVRHLGIRGPAVRVQTACSTSLVAIHDATQALLNYQCDVAVAGGVSLQYTTIPGYPFHDGEIFSPDGYCRTFDRQANGTVLGEGCGIVVLRRLRDALAEGSDVLAVVLGSAINNDGDDRAGYTAPGVAGQAALVERAQETAGVSPDVVSYIEAHGTGTPLGDPIEVTALANVFRKGTSDGAFCGLGSIKTNIGHLDAAAGVAGFMKAVCALQHRVLPPTLHYAEPNPDLRLESSPFYVVDKAQDWQPRHERRVAGVSSFGLGGTNAHVVLEEHADG